MVKKIRCDVDGNDWVKAEVSVPGNAVSLLVMLSGEDQNVILTPDDARKLRKQIKKALAAIEGVDGDGGAEEEEPVAEPDNSKPKVGDRIRILFDRADCAPVHKGNEFIVRDVDKEDGGVIVAGDRNWAFSPENFEVIGGAVSDCKPA